MSRRRDAVRNRELLVAAGREVFAERGEDATLEEVARRARVGIGTLYRHFPTREALVEVIYEEHIAEVLDAAEQAIGQADAWEGLGEFLERALALQARNLALRDVFFRHAVGEGPIAERRKEIRPLLDRLLARAREQGALRADFTLGDLFFAVWSFTPLFEAAAEVAPDAWRRHLRILLDGMRAQAASRQRARPLGRAQLEAAIAARRGRYQRPRAA